MLEGVGDEFVTVEAASDGDGRGRLGVLTDNSRGVLSGSNADGVMHIVPFEVAEEDGGRCDPSDAGPVTNVNRTAGNASCVNSGVACQRRDEPSTSVNRNVTVPVGISDGVALTSLPPVSIADMSPHGRISSGTQSPSRIVAPAGFERFVAGNSVSPLWVRLFVWKGRRSKRLSARCAAS